MQQKVYNIDELKHRLNEEVIEMHDALDRTIQGFNDLIFDTDRLPRYSNDKIMTETEKEYLKAQITALLSPPSDIDAQTDEARIAGINILTNDEQDLVRALLSLREEGRA
ncbi:hypothetical protein B0H14DRAFT_3868956 [Mycena olivaceomarginata]|nr:hypothetical protein B0H14DRAFT_3868956 [Mycena olivaceomarginata]